MPKYNNTKNCITDLAIANPKTKVITQVKVQTTKKRSDKTIVHAQSCNLQAKVYQYKKNTLINLVKGAHQQKNAENSKIFKNKKLANRFFKIKNSTNQIHAVLPLSYVYF